MCNKLLVAIQFLRTFRFCSSSWINRLTKGRVLQRVTQSHLERCAHKTITLATGIEDQEMDFKHKHIDANRHRDQADGACNEVIEPHARSDLEIAPEQPELIDCRCT